MQNFNLFRNNERESHRTRNLNTPLGTQEFPHQWNVFFTKHIDLEKHRSMPKPSRDQLRHANCEMSNDNGMPPQRETLPKNLSQEMNTQCAFPNLTAAKTTPDLRNRSPSEEHDAHWRRCCDELLHQHNHCDIFEHWLHLKNIGAGNSDRWNATRDIS